MKLVFASNNTHKLEEVRQILPAYVDVISLKELGFFQEIKETGETLEANSNLKAQVVWEWVCENGLSDRIDGVFADDTGLEIAALGGTAQSVEALIVPMITEQGKVEVNVAIREHM